MFILDQINDIHERLLGMDNVTTSNLKLQTQSETTFFCHPIGL